MVCQCAVPVHMAHNSDPVMHLAHKLDSVLEKKLAKLHWDLNQ